MRCLLGCSVLFDRHADPDGLFLLGLSDLWGRPPKRRRWRQPGRDSDAVWASGLPSEPPVSSREKLGARGRAIWAAYRAESLAAGNQALILEIARLADGLDKLDGLLSGSRADWGVIELDELGEVHLVIDSLLSERRQQQLAFKQLLMEARQAGLKQTGEKIEREESNGRGGLILDITDRLG